jgi:hypothetical protein
VQRPALDRKQVIVTGWMVSQQDCETTSGADHATKRTIRPRGRTRSSPLPELGDRAQAVE